MLVRWNFRLRNSLCTFLSGAMLALPTLGTSSAEAQDAQREVVAFWNFPFEDDFPGESAPVNYWAFGTAIGSRAEESLLTAFIGAAMKDLDPNIDPNGGNGLAYTSEVSSITYPESHSLRWEDLRSPGNNFEIDGSSDVFQDRGEGPILEDFSNDALVYIQLDGSGLSDFEIRFDVQVDNSTPATSFDLFYRIDGAGGIWYRSPAYNNLSLNLDAEFEGTATVILPEALDDQGNIELILNDFDEGDPKPNDNLEIDNVEITAAPEPTAALGALTSTLTLGILRARRVASE